MSRFVAPLRRRLMVRALEDRLAPALFTVNTLIDNGVGAGSTGDLRYCINQANSTPGADTITFSISGSVVLTSQLKITGQTQLDGPAALNVAIDGNKVGGIFDIQTSLPVAINNLAFVNGSVFNGGGAIRISASNAVVSLSKCMLANNTGGVGSPGGAIFVGANGSLTMDQCTVSGNSGLRGAGLYFYIGGSLNMTNSTLSGNMQSGSSNGGGAIYFYGQVGANGFNIQNTTISGNTASGRGGGISINFGDGQFNISNSTITKNLSFSGGGGGIAATTTTAKIRLDSTIVAQNSHSSSPDILDVGTVTADHSLIGVTDGIATLMATSCVTGNLVVPEDAKLGPLANNGGLTQTHLPLPGSPVRNLGSNPNGLTTDQRGLARTVETFVDIGSVESAGAIPTAVLVPMATIDASAAGNTTPNTVQVIYSDGIAIDASTIDIGDIQILDPVGKALLVIGVSVDNSTNGTPRTATYTFIPPGGTWDKADSGFYKVNVLNSQVFNTSGPNAVLPGTIGSFVVSMSNTYVVNATNDEVIDTDGKMSLREAIARADAPGSPDTITFDSAVFAGSQTITLALGDYVLNDAMSIVGPAAKVTINALSKSRHFTIDANGTGSVFSLSDLILINGKRAGVTPDDRGGSIRVADENVTISGCTLTNNTAEATGGAIYTDSAASSLTIQDSVITNNASTGATAFQVGTGGGISMGQQGTLKIDRTTVANNVSAGAGGGLYFYFGGQVDITNTTISGNTANGTFGGGGVYFYGLITGTGCKIINTTISGNIAVAGPGGGICAALNGGTIQIFNSTVVNNISKSGGGITRSGGSSPDDSFKLSSTIVAGNKLNNVSATPFDISLPFPGKIEGNNNLVGVTDLANFTLTGTGNKTGTSASPLDAKLGPLADHGGPTFTHAPLPGSPAIDAGNNALGLTFDQRGAPNVRFDGPAPDIGAFEIQTGPAKILSVIVNDGAVQRSRVLSVTVNFDRFITFFGAPTAAFSLTRQSDNMTVGLSVSVDNSGSGSSVRLTFVSGAVDGTSLKDGRYTLRIFANQFAGTGFDGNGNGVADGSPADDYVVIGGPTSGEKLFRLFGDADGNGLVDGLDFGAFRVAFNTGSVIFDFDGSGIVDGLDFGQFRQRFGVAI